MPELPEVETIARSLAGAGAAGGVQERADRRAPVVGSRILSAEVFWRRTIADPAEGFERRIAGQRIEAAGRRAKFLLLTLDRDTLVIHLRMSGDIHVRPGGEPPAPHDRVVFHLSGGIDMAFNDTRKFGRVWLLEDPAPLFAGLGPEPFGEEFTRDWLFDNLSSRNRQIKPLLLDQSFLAGMGNIYADESLHRAGIHPLRSSRSVSRAESDALWGHIRAVLAEGIRSNGASIDWVYRGGEFQNYFRVYGREGEPCRRCGESVARIVVGQRGTHFCPACQPESL